MLLAGDLVTSTVTQKSRTPDQVARRAALRATGKSPTLLRELDGNPRPNTDRCGEMLRLVGEPCARLVGHADSHRSRASLESDNARRRAS